MFHLRLEWQWPALLGFLVPNAPRFPVLLLYIHFTVVTRDGISHSVTHSYSLLVSNLTVQVEHPPG